MPARSIALADFLIAAKTKKNGKSGEHRSADHADVARLGFVQSRKQQQTEIDAFQNVFRVQPAHGEMPLVRVRGLILEVIAFVFPWEGDAVA